MEKFLARRPRLRHGTPEWVEDPEFFITVCCQSQGKNHLCKEGNAQQVFQAFQFYHLRKDCRVELLVLMPDHLHLIIKLPDSVQLACWMRSLKRWISRKTGVRFQENFFDHRLRSPASAKQKWDYVNMNPVRAGLISRPEDWPYRYTLSDFEAKTRRPRDWPPYLAVHPQPVGRVVPNPPRSIPRVHHSTRRSRRDRPT